MIVQLTLTEISREKLFRCHRDRSQPTSDYSPLNFDVNVDKNVDQKNADNEISHRSQLRCNLRIDKQTVTVSLDLGGYGALVV